ncbi:hypothetical protein GQ53DRAFT_690492 [Thozetella sp. PMI_491]|nr:hypothetical protein GQ53DRAFT_690492 [Thozetella sp. PMI_491]
MSAPQAPSLPRRMTSAMVMGMTGLVSKCFLFGLNRVDVVGLPRFLELLDGRQDPDRRQRGLITVSNHISVVDDPVIWGVLPLSYAFRPSNLRWSLGAHDICFKNRLLDDFFTAGQVLPTHRLKHSPHGGLFQPSITQAIRLLSSQPYSASASLGAHPEAPRNPEVLDPFTSGQLTFTIGDEVRVAPSSYLANRHSWVHVFPEGMVHQHATTDVRYFKWGVARLILEAEPPPDVVPMFIDGTQHVMHEDRKFPRFAPRIGKQIRVAFGEKLDFGATFGDLRQRWRSLVERRRAVQNADILGELLDEDLRCGKEADEIRIEVARRVRESVLQLRASLGYSESDPSYAYAETWALDDKGPKQQKYKSSVDGSQVSSD